MADRQTAKAQSILKYVDAFLNRKTGRTYAFFRRRGQRIVLPGLIGSPEFMSGYHAALRGEQADARYRRGDRTHRPRHRQRRSHAVSRFECIREQGAERGFPPAAGLDPAEVLRPRR
jgi:hypothetical protein